MFQLVYASTAVRPMQPKDLNRLLHSSRLRNKQAGITGLLLYGEEHFLQVLEGEEAAVRRLYHTIRADERHTAVITLRERLLEAREFGSWTMGFANLDRPDPGALPEGPVPFSNGRFTPDYFRKNTVRAHRTLLKFREAPGRRRVHSREAAG